VLAFVVVKVVMVVMGVGVGYWYGRLLFPQLAVGQRRRFGLLATGHVCIITADLADRGQQYLSSINIIIIIIIIKVEPHQAVWTVIIKKKKKRGTDPPNNTREVTIGIQQQFVILPIIGSHLKHKQTSINHILTTMIVRGFCFLLSSLTMMKWWSLSWIIMMDIVNIECPKKTAQS